MPQETSKGDDQAVSAEICNLENVTIFQLRAKWATVFRAKPPIAFGPDLLRRSLAQRIQERAIGGLTGNARRELDRAVQALDRKPTGRIDLPRRTKPGAVLIRQWKDSTHRVMVLEQGYSYEGETYLSLSELAREITGTRWNGPRFFGLRATRPARAHNLNWDSGDSPQDSPRRRRGRPRKPIQHADRQQPLVEARGP